MTTTRSLVQTFQTLISNEPSNPVPQKSIQVIDAKEPVKSSNLNDSESAATLTSINLAVSSTTSADIAGIEATSTATTGIETTSADTAGIEATITATAGIETTSTITAGIETTITATTSTVTTTTTPQTLNQTSSLNSDFTVRISVLILGNQVSNGISSIVQTLNSYGIPFDTVLEVNGVFPSLKLEDANGSLLIG